MSWYDPEDYAQEMALAKLEGMTQEAAEKRARKASRRRPFFGHHTLMSLDGLPHTTATEQTPLTMDYRTDEEREESWAKDIEHVKAIASPRQWDLMATSVGITTGGQPLKNSEVAEMFGLRSPSKVPRAFKEVREKMERFGDAEAFREYKRDIARAAAKANVRNKGGSFEGKLAS